MKTELAGEAGFCFGVRRAIQLAFDVVAEQEGPIYTLGPIIHNPQMVARLEEKGVRPIFCPSEVAPGIVIIRSHGVAPEVIGRVNACGHRIVDATCPFVRRAQEDVQALREEGYHIILVGKRDHAEVEGLVGYAGKGVNVIWEMEDLESLEQLQRTGVVAQTTTPFDRFRTLVGGLLEKSRQLKIYNTICHSTENRQTQTLELAKRADVMIIIGGRNSANTTRLAELCRDLGSTTYHVETADEICADWMKEASLVGVAAGASTPDWIIDGVMCTLERIAHCGTGTRGPSHPESDIGTRNA